MGKDIRIIELVSGHTIIVRVAIRMGKHNDYFYHPRLVNSEGELENWPRFTTGVKMVSLRDNHIIYATGEIDEVVLEKYEEYIRDIE